MLAVSLLATATATWYVYVTTHEKDEIRFREDTIQTREVIARRVETYVALLRGTAGLFAGSVAVEQDEFRSFVDRIMQGGLSPGTLGIGYSKRLMPGELDPVTMEVRLPGGPGPRVWPAGSREEYHAILYLEPRRDNEHAIGYDMFTDSVRRDAMTRARDDGVAAASGLVRLVQDEGRPDAPAGFLIYLPVYRGGRVPGGVEERRELLEGFAYAPLRLGEVLAGLFGGAEPAVDFEIYDGSTADPVGLMHRSRAGDQTRRPLVRVDTMEVAGRPWTFVFKSRPGFFAGSERGLTPLTAAAGTLMSFVLFGLVRAEAASRRIAQESQARKEAILESALDCIVTMDGSGRIIEFNPAAEQLLGYRYEEVRGRTFSETIVPERLRAAHEAGLRRMAAGGNGPFIGERMEMPALQADGSEIPVELTVMVARPEGGEAFSTASMRDLRGRKAAEEALRQSEARFRLMADAAPVLIWLAGPDRAFYWFNRTWLDFTGRTMEQEVGDGWAQGVHPDDRERCAATLSAAFNRRAPFEMDYRLRRHDGEYRWMVGHGVPIYGHDGSFGGLIGSCTDITDRKLAEEALAKQAAELARSNADLTNFAHVAAHDLKEPLRGIRHFSTFLLEDYTDQLDEAGKHKLSTLDLLAKRMHDLLDALLLLAQVGETPLTVVEADMGELAAGVVGDLASMIREAGAEVTVAPDLPRVRCDATLAGQVLSNLVVNAIKYNDSDSKRVEIGCVRGGRPPVLYVRDNGIGIAGVNQEIIFRMFKRLHGRDRYGGGSGAGLAIVKKIVERHGGRIWLVSEPGRGATFYFTLGPPVHPWVRQESMREN